MANDTQATEPEAPAEEETQVADTADTQPSEASSQEVEAPEATQDKAAPQEGAEQTEVEAEDTAEEKLYAGKYKSPEDMEKAYTELQSKFSQTTSEKAELSKILNEAFLGDDQSQEAADDDYDDDFSTERKRDPVVDKLERRTVVQDFIFTHPDADGDSMKEVLANDPHVQNIGSYDAKLEYAYYKSQNMSQQKAVEKAREEGAKKTQAKIAEKQTAQVESAKKAEPTSEKDELRTTATTGTPEERKAARLQYIKKYL